MGKILYWPFLFISYLYFNHSNLDSDGQAEKEGLGNVITVKGYVDSMPFEDKKFNVATSSVIPVKLINFIENFF